MFIENVTYKNVNYLNNSKNSDTKRYLQLVKIHMIYIHGHPEDVTKRGIYHPPGLQI